MGCHLAVYRNAVWLRYSGAALASHGLPPGSTTQHCIAALQRRSLGKPRAAQCVAAPHVEASMALQQLVHCLKPLNQRALHCYIIACFVLQGLHLCHCVACASGETCSTKKFNLTLYTCFGQPGSYLCFMLHGLRFCHCVACTACEPCSTQHIMFSTLCACFGQPGSDLRPCSTCAAGETCAASETCDMHGHAALSVGEP